MSKASWAAVAICVTSLLASARVEAQEVPSSFGARHQATISSERLFGFVRSSQTSSSGGIDTTTTVTSFSLVGNLLSFTSLYSTPRLALDIFATDRFSLGGSFSFFTVSESSSATGAGPNAVEPSFTGFTFMPRIGYALPLGRSVSLWPRLGFTYVHLSSSGSGTTSTDLNLYAATLEVPVVFTVANHLFFSVAPTLDLGLGGSTSLNVAGTSTSVDAKETDYGAQCAFGGFF
jgi:hypothetical protein